MGNWIPQSRVVLKWGDVFVCEPDWTWSVRDLPHFDLWYVTHGAGWIEGPQEGSAMRAGDCLLLRPGGSYQARCEEEPDPQRSLRLIAIHFNLVDPRGGKFMPRPEQLPPFRRQMQAHQLFDQLLTRAISSYQDGSSEWASAWLQAAWMEVIRQDRRTWPAGPLGERARKIQEMCDEIRAHPERTVWVEDLAAEVHVSPEHFCRIFRRLQGMSPRAFITRARIEAARTLLLTSSYPIARIARMLGYDDPFHFSRQFKAKVGIAPSELRSGTH